MKNKILEGKVIEEKRATGRYSKETFNMLLKESGKGQSKLLRYLNSQQELTEKDLTKYDSSYLSNMCREKSNRKPTKEISDFLEKFLIEEGVLSEKFRMSGSFALQYKSKIEQESEQESELEDYEYQEEMLMLAKKCYIEEMLSDTMLNVLHDNFDMICQFNSVLWDLIEKLEKCTKEKLLQFKCEFQRKHKGSETLMRNEPELKEALNFSWNCIMEDREKVVNDIVEWWESYDVPVWNRLEVFANLNEEIWEIVKMIILSNYYPDSEDFSPKIRRELDEYFG